VILPISASQVARITVVSHPYLEKLQFFISLKKGISGSQMLCSVAFRTVFCCFPLGQVYSKGKGRCILASQHFVLLSPSTGESPSKESHIVGTKQDFPSPHGGPHPPAQQ
jgi:hypothetical protein